jgi:hypothetical protein
MKIIITESKLNSVVLKWLDNEYGNLTKLVKGDRTYYVDQEGLPLFVYYQGKKIVYINYKRIWKLLKSIFVMNDQQIKNILKIWLEETYNLKGYPPEVERYVGQLTL